MRKKNNHWLLMLSPIVLALAACGGGSSSNTSGTNTTEGENTPPTSEISIQGLYIGTHDWTYHQHPDEGPGGRLLTFIDQDNEYWSTYQRWPQEVMPFLYHGKYTYTNGNLNLLDQAFVSEEKFTNVTNAVTLKPEARLDSTLRFSEDASEFAVHGSAPYINGNSGIYDYAKKPSLNEVTGEWTWGNNEPFLEVAPDGTISDEGYSTDILNGKCGSIARTLAPSGSDRNYYTVSFKGENCTQLDQENAGPTWSVEAKGIAYVFNDNGKETLVLYTKTTVEAMASNARAETTQSILKSFFLTRKQATAQDEAVPAPEQEGSATQEATPADMAAPE